MEEDGKIMAGPTERKSQAIRADKKGKQRATEMGKRRGRQLIPAQISTRLDQAHAQWNYEASMPEMFTVADEMVGRIEWAILWVKPSRRVGRDVVHYEMLYADQVTWSDLLTAWWMAVRCYALFPRKWKHVVICPLYKKRLQSNLMNRRRECFLSNSSKVIDNAVLSILHEPFTPSFLQLGFLEGVALTPKLLQAKDSEKARPRHAAAFYLEKAYDKANFCHLFKTCPLPNIFAE